MSWLRDVLGESAPVAPEPQESSGAPKRPPLQAAPVAPLAPVDLSKVEVCPRVSGFEILDYQDKRAGAENLHAIQTQVRQLAGDRWHSLLQTMTPKRWESVTKAAASAADSVQFLRDWTTRNVLALNIARGVVSPEQSRPVICRSFGPVYTMRSAADDPTGQDGNEYGFDCVLSCEWCGRGEPNCRPETAPAPGAWSDSDDEPAAHVEAQESERDEQQAAYFHA